MILYDRRDDAKQVPNPENNQPDERPVFIMSLRGELQRRTYFLGHSEPRFPYRGAKLSSPRR